MRTQARLEQLEKAVNPPAARKIEVAFCLDVTPAEQAKRIAEAHERAGENGTVIVVVYEDEQTKPEAVQ